jgi:hypothetical protein
VGKKKKPMQLRNIRRRYCGCMRQPISG